MIDLPALDPIAAAWREKLLETVEPVKDLPILLSGGMDSVTLALCQVILGGRPVCYSYRLGTFYSDDWTSARNVAAALELPFVDVPIERSEAVLRRDLDEILLMTRRWRKTVVQCVHPMLYLSRRIAADGHRGAVVGTGAIILDDRTVAVLAASSEAEALEYRRLKLDDKNQDCGTGWMHRSSEMLGVPLREPYSEEPVAAHALELSYREMNRPRQKGIALRAFPGFFKDLRRFWRRNSPLQINGGIRRWHKDLLGFEDLNPSGRWVRVQAVYRRRLDQVVEGEAAA